VIISLILSALMLGAIAAGLAVRRRAPAVGIAIVVAALTGFYFAWMPAHLNVVARALGVGRGADLLLYLWVSLTFLALAGVVLELRRLQRQVTLLARDLALHEARRETAALPRRADPVADDGARGPER
jgi:hypothetical protein